MSLSTAAALTVTFLAVVWSLTLRGSVRLVAPKAENAWDNALAYTLVSAALLWVLRWLMMEAVWWSIPVAPLLLVAVPVWTLRVVYQIPTRRAAALAAVQFGLASTIIFSTLFTVAFIAAYLTYGRIISDPWMLVRLLLRLIGLGV